MSVLRESAKDCPHCMSCMIGNPNGDLLCLAHSNELRHGRGMGHKSKDEHGAILCMKCHDLCDGRTGGLSKTQKHTKLQIAHLRTVSWWLENGYPVPLE